MEAEIEEKTYLNQPYIADVINKGLEFYNRGDLYKAQHTYRKVLEVEPRNPDAMHLLGITKLHQGDYSQAIAFISEAIKIFPNNPEYYEHLATCLAHDKKFDQAIEFYKKALAIRPCYPSCLLNLGMILTKCGNLEESIAVFSRGLEYNPRDGKILNEIVKTLKLACLWDKVSSYENDLKKITLKNLKNNKPPSISPYNSLLCSYDNEQCQQIAASYVRHNFSIYSSSIFDHEQSRSNKIRIGYVCGDFRNHPTSHLIRRLFELHDKSNFDVYAYSFGPDDGSIYRKHLENSAGHFKNLQQCSDIEAAKTIYDDKIDILVDLMGHIQNSRFAIFATKPAPIQVNYLAYPGTSGADFIDYIVSDKVVIPEGEEHCYQEQILYMPDSYFITDNQAEVASCTKKEQLGLPEDTFIFCCFNKINKIDKVVFSIWMEILRSKEDSVLWLQTDDKYAISNLQKHANDAKIDPNRLIFAPKRAKNEHLARYGYADLFIDCINVSAHTTAIDALYMGVPVITLYGNKIINRAAASILQAAGLPELITHDIDSYKQAILKYANSPNELQALKSKVRDNIKTSSLFDTEKYVAELENLYQKIYKTI